MEFKYKAKKSLSDIIEGKIEAESLEQAIEKIEQEGMTAISVEPQEFPRPHLKIDLAHLGSAKFGLKQLTLFTQKLYNLTKSQVELLTALRLLAQGSTNATERALLEDIIKHLKDGMLFSQCLSLYPQYFSLLYVSIIRIGESSGRLKEVLEQLLNQLQRLEGLRAKIRQALAYPIFMIVVGIITIFIMLTFILPRLTSIFEDFQANLPLPTLILLNIAAYLKKYWLFIAVFLWLLIIILQKKHKDGSNLFFKIKYHLPLIRRLIYKQSIANFSASTSLLLKSGITLLSSLGIVAPIIGHPSYIKQLEQIRQYIKEGDSFSQALARFKIFPDFFIQMIRVGEQAGRLDTTLQDIADSYEQEIEADLKIISSLIEPAIILGLGLIIGGIVIAVLLPIFNINMLVGH